jgi:hypothetical protein
LCRWRAGFAWLELIKSVLLCRVSGLALVAFKGNPAKRNHFDVVDVASSISVLSG